MIKMEQVKPEKTGFLNRVGMTIDRVIGVFSPARGAMRSYARDLQMSFTTRGGRRSGRGVFRGARVDRTNSDWMTSDGSADEDMLWDLDLLRSRSRDLARNDPYASAIIGTMSTNTIGVGIRPQSRVEQESIGITPELAHQHEKMAERVWHRAYPHLDAAGRLDFYEMQELVHKQIMVNGESIVIERQINQPHRPYQLAYDIIESDRLFTPETFVGDKRVRNGVRLGNNGEPIGYYILKSHPGDVYFRENGRSDYTYYPLYNEAGRKQVFHLYWTERPGQNRGYPFLAPIIDYFNHKQKYLEAEAIANRVAACFTAFIKKNSPYSSILGRTDSVEGNRRLEKLGPGRIEYLAEGEEVQFANPMRQASQFDTFQKALMFEMAAAVGMPYILVAKDFSKTNYSSARAALLEARRYFKKAQDWLSRKFFHPVYCNVQEEAFLRGEFGVIDFYEFKDYYCRARWIASGWEWVDPVKEAQAAKLAIDSGLSTHSDEAASKGKDFEENVDTMGREYAYIKSVSEKYGVDLFQMMTGNNSKTTPSAAANGKPDDEEEEEEED